MPIRATSDILLALLGSDSGSAVMLASPKKPIGFEGLEFDSRQIKGGELFVALPGEVAHGNSFIEAALSRGAGLILADQARPLPEISEKDRVILVNNPLQAFWKIAAWWRDQINLPTLAITGSVGKTTVKEMAASILLQRGIVTYSLKSHNNHVGVPYTICRASPDNSCLVLEVGMNHRGEIAPLSRLAQPQIAVITNVAPAHIGHLKSLESIAVEKLDICLGLKPHAKTADKAFLLINAQTTVLKEQLSSVQLPETTAIEFFGVDIEAEGALSEVRSMGLDGITFKLSMSAKPYSVSMKVLGRQNAWNAACAARAVRLLDPSFSPEEIVRGLERFTAPLMRLNIKCLKDGSVVIDDSYNANPASMASAIELLADIRKDQERVGLVLGDMLELGDFSPQYHREISELIVQLRPHFVIAVGEASSDYGQAIVGTDIPFAHCSSALEASAIVAQKGFDFLLVKASRGIGLDRVVIDLVNSRGELIFAPDQNRSNEK